MINSTWIVPPVDVANQNLEDIFYLTDIQNGIQINEFLAGTPDDAALIAGLQLILNALYNTTVNFNDVTVVVSSITKGRAKVALEQINAGLISH